MAPRKYFPHVGAVLLLAVFTLIRWWPYLGSASSLGDEGIYLQAFAQVASGGAAEDVSGYYYPPISAALGAAVLATVGETVTRVLLRLGSVLGLAVSLWISLSLWPATWQRRLLVALLYVGLAPAVHYGIAAGNASFVVTGMILLALAFWSARPVLSGLLLGASVAIKPLAPLSVAALLAHRPLPPTSRHWLAGGVAAIGAGILLLPAREYLSTAAGSVDRLPFIRSISLNRILTLLGLEVRPIIVACVLAIVIVVIARLIPMSRREFLCFGGVAAIVAIPIIWSHTLLLTLPTQVFALSLAFERRQKWKSSVADFPRGGAKAAWRRYEPIFVCLAVAALQLTEGAGAIDDHSVIFQLTILTGAYLAAPVLMAYVLSMGRRRVATPVPRGDSLRLSRKERQLS